MQSSPYLSVSAQDFQEQERARRQANEQYVRLLPSYREAERYGCYSIKRLKGMGLSVPEYMRQCYRFVVETQYGRLPVYSIDQCKAKNGDKLHDQASATPSLDLQAPDGYASITVEGWCSKQLTTTFLNGPYDPNEHRRIYCPENWEPSELPDDLLPHWEEMARLFHVIHLQRIEQGKRQDEFAHAKKRYLENQLPNLRNWLNRSVERGYFERDEHYQIGKFSMGYRAGAEWQTTHRVQIVNLLPSERRRARRKRTTRRPVQEWLARNLERIRLDGTPGFGDEQEERESEKLETHAVYQERDRFGHRFHSCLTNVRREWRHCLRVDGRALHMSDVANSQPLVLASVLREKGIRGCDEYVRLCEEGRFYDQAAEELGVARDDAKRNLVSYVFFGKNKYRSRYHAWLQERFPPVYEFVRTVKRTDYARLARVLQRQESKIVISGACDDMMLLEPGMFVATIHDALLYLPEDRETVEGRLREAFGRFGVRVTLKHTSYEERP